LLAIFIFSAALPFSVFAADAPVDSDTNPDTEIKPEVESAQGFDNFSDRYEYSDELFLDISSGYWYGKYVAKVFALGLMEGMGNQRFAPKESASIAEAITLAARLHNIYHGGDGLFERSVPWYQVYVDYAYANGIIDDLEMSFSNRATRREFAEILCAAFPDEAFNVISDIPDDSIPDIKMDDEGAEAIYKLYRAGVLTGSDDRGTFYPDDTINRAAVATILSRMAIRNMRIQFALKAYSGPDTPVQSLAGDDFFADACLIGNSLCEGIRIYSNLKTMTYFSRTSMTVLSAFSGRDFAIYPGYYGSAMEAVSVGKYGKVYIELGINEIGFPVETFVEYYSRIIEHVQKVQPAADIYILSLTPVSRAKDAGGTFTMARVNAYNEGLKQLAADSHCYFIDCVSPLVDETGFLPSADTWDGVHFNIPKYAEWENIIRTRYVD